MFSPSYRHFLISLNIPSQVKELGVVIRGSRTIGGDLHNLFESWWQWAALAKSPEYNFNNGNNGWARQVYSPSLQTTLTVPCWHVEVKKDSCASPILYSMRSLNRDLFDFPIPPSSIQQQVNTTLNGSYATYFISSSPPEIAAQLSSDSSVDVVTYDVDNVSSPQWMSPIFFVPSNSYGTSGFTKSYRANDIDGIVWSILTAKKFVYISVMDFLPASEYSASVSWLLHIYVCVFQ